MKDKSRRAQSARAVELSLTDALIEAREHPGGLVAWHPDRTSVYAVASDMKQLIMRLTALGVRVEDTDVEQLEVPDYDIGYGLHPN